MIGWRESDSVPDVINAAWSAHGKYVGSIYEAKLDASHGASVPIGEQNFCLKPAAPKFSLLLPGSSEPWTKLLLNSCSPGERRWHGLLIAGASLAQDWSVRCHFLPSNEIWCARLRAC